MYLRQAQLSAPNRALFGRQILWSCGNYCHNWPWFRLVAMAIKLLIRDVNFREFYFSIREFQISRLVEYSKLNAALGDGPWRSLRSPHPLGINYRRVEATAATASISLTGWCAGTSFSCPTSGGCYRFIVSRFKAHRQASDRCWTLMLCSLTLWRPLLPYGYSYKASCARPGCHLYFWHPGTLTLTLSSKVPRWQKLQMTA